MNSRKICMVGAFAVGKTSLVRQFVESLFSEKYHTTIGVKIDKRVVEVKGEPVQLIIWDIEGVDIFTELKPSYLRGASGIILVMDGTRYNTLTATRQVMEIVEKSIGATNFVLLINKHDLISEWQIKDEHLISLGIDEKNIFKTSAKTGDNVEAAFKRLAELILSPGLI